MAATEKSGVNKVVVAGSKIAMAMTAGVFLAITAIVQLESPIFIMVAMVLLSVAFWFIVWNTAVAPCDLPGAKQPPEDGDIAPEELPFGSLNLSSIILMYAIYSYALTVTLNGFFQLVDGKDPLVIEVLSTNLISIDSWSIVHVQNFCMVGFLFPDRNISMFVYGIIWEVVEYRLAKKALINWYEPPVNSLWDLWFNLLGYWIGQWLVYSWVMKQRSVRRLNKKKP